LAQSNKNVIGILTKKTNEYILDFYLKFEKKYKFEVFFILDSPLENNKNFIFINDKICEKYNCRNLTFTTLKKFTSWDRGICFFNYYFQNYDFVWIIEDDVFIKSTKDLKDIIEKYKNKNFDLIASYIKQKKEFKNWSNWKLLKAHYQYFENFEYRSINPFCRISKELIKNTCSYLKNYINLSNYFHELIFINICKKNNLNYKSFNPIKDKIRIRWRPEINLEDLKNENKVIFHPLKNYDLIKKI